MSAVRSRYEGQVAWASVVSQPNISRCSSSHLRVDLVARYEQEILPFVETTQPRQLNPK